MTDPANRLKEALEALGIVRVVRVESVLDRGQIRLLCRVSNERRPDVPAGSVSQAWLSVVDAILIEEERLVEELQDQTEVPEEHTQESDIPEPDQLPPWNVHICKHYMRHNGRLVFGWNFTLQTNAGMIAAVSDICRLLTIMSRHVGMFLNTPVVHQSAVRGGVTQQAAMAPTQSYRPSTVPGAGTSGRIVDGQVVEMPLVGVTAQRNTPQAPILTPGVAGRGRKSGVSSKGAHVVRVS